MINDLCSVIMPVFNSSQYIEEAVNSVLTQSYEKLELLIIDDGSTDNTLSMAKKMNKLDSRIRIVESCANEGVAQARNKGLREAKGEYIAFLDSDDLWSQDKLKAQIAFLKKDSKVDICFSEYSRIKSDGQIITERVTVPLEGNYQSLLKHNYIPMLTSIVRKAALGGAEFHSVGHEDYLFWLTLLKKPLTAKSIPQVLASYRVTPGSLSANKLRSFQWLWRIFRYKEKLSLFTCVYLVFNVAIRSRLKLFRRN